MSLVIFPVKSVSKWFKNALNIYSSYNFYGNLYISCDSSGALNMDQRKASTSEKCLHKRNFSTKKLKRDIINASKQRNFAMTFRSTVLRLGYLNLLV